VLRCGGLLLKCLPRLKRAISHARQVESGTWEAGAVSGSFEGSRGRSDKREAGRPHGAGLAGSERVRRHPRHRPRSAPHDGVSDGPGASKGPGPLRFGGAVSLRREAGQFRDRLKLAQIFRLVLGEPPHHAHICQELGEVARIELAARTVGPVRGGFSAPVTSEPDRFRRSRSEGRSALNHVKAGEFQPRERWR